MPKALLTQPYEFDLPTEGYIVIAPLSAEGKKHVADIQARYVERFGEEALWLPEPGQFHITFAHILTPDVKYPQEPSAMFAHLQPLASATLSKTITRPFAVHLRFNTVAAFPDAVILKATDDGTYDKLRSQFVEKFQPPPGARMPPKIIHTTLLRFRQPIEFAEVQKLTREVMDGFEPFDELTTSLQMIREKKIFVQEHEVLEEFPA